MRVLAGLLAALCLLGAGEASAHTRSQSASYWRVDGDSVLARVEADSLDVTRLYALGDIHDPMEEVFRRHVAESFRVSTPAGPCTPSGEARPTPSSTGRIAVALAFACPAGSLASGRLSIEGTLFLSVAATHLHFLQASDGAGGEGEAVLTDTHRRADLTLVKPAAADGAWSAFRRFIPIGVVHVWTGLDHIAFILALTLLAGRARAAVIAASGFTLGHSATLALAALGALAPHTPTVESLIGFTVAFVALRTGKEGPDRLRRWAPWAAAALAAVAAWAAVAYAPVGPLTHLGLALFVLGFGLRATRGGAGGAAPWIAGVFGLIHGCGFAGALQELDLPRPRLLSAVAGFNVGVELAQIAVIAAALIALPYLRRVRGGPAVAAAGLFGLGLYWFASRALGA